jgi:antitoxin ParD1/3/4
MASMNISLPNPMREWVERQTQGGRYDNASEYVRDLIRHDQDRLSKVEAMQRLVDEALQGGETELSLEQIRAKARKTAGTSET